MCDRTSEFLQCANRAAGPSAATLKKRVDDPKTRDEFHVKASEIAKGVHRTSGVLKKLTDLVRSQGLFNDPTEEINNMVYRIKQDLDEMNNMCDSAQKYVDGKKKLLGEKNQLTNHNGKVVSQLKTDLMHTTKDFKTVLETRASKMKETQTRKVALTGQSPVRLLQSAQKPGKGTGAGKYPMPMDGHKDGLNPMTIGSPSPYNNGTALTEFGGQDGGNDFAQQSQQMMFAPLAINQYYDSRVQAVSEVDKTITELGTIFKRLSEMILAQQELVERIDEDVEQASDKINDTTKLLTNLYNNGNNNKALYTKIGVLMALFTLFFVLFLM
jgi:syntaxin 5